MELIVNDKGLDIRTIEVKNIKECYDELRKIMEEFNIQRDFLNDGREPEVRCYLSGMMGIFDDVLILNDRDCLIVDFGDWNTMVFIKGTNFRDFTKKIFNGDVS